MENSIAEAPISTTTQAEMDDIEIFEEDDEIEHVPPASKKAHHEVEPEAQTPPSLCQLPDDIIQEIVPLLHSIKLQFKLSIASKRFVVNGTILSKIEFYRAPKTPRLAASKGPVKCEVANPNRPYWLGPLETEIFAYFFGINSPREPNPDFFHLVRRLPNLTSIKAHFSQIEAWRSHRETLFATAHSLKKLHLKLDSSQPEEMIRDLLDPDRISGLQPFSKLEHLAISYDSRVPIRQDISFRLFPQLRKLTLSFSGTHGIHWAVAISRDCPELKHLEIFRKCVSDTELHMLRKLKNLVKIDVTHLSNASVQEISRTLFETQYIEPGQQEFSRYLSALWRISPVCFGLRLQGKLILDGLLRFSHLWSSAAKLVALKRIAANEGCPFDFTHLVSPGSTSELILSLAKLDSLKTLIRSEFDLGLLISGPELGEAPLLSHLLVYNASVEMFQLLFEDRSIAPSGMTAFEYAKSQHPDYPFFWDLPLFTCVMQREKEVKEDSGGLFCATRPTPRKFKPEAQVLNLSKYLLENRGRLLPMFGSEIYFGGPSIPDIYMRYPVHLVKLVDELAFLKDHDAVCWPLNAAGTTLSSFDFSRASPSCLSQLVKTPPFGTSFINSDGFSLLDLVIQYGAQAEGQKEHTYYLLRCLLSAVDSGTVHLASPHTSHMLRQSPQIVVEFEHDQVVAILKLVEQGEVQGVLQGWLECEFLRNHGSKLVDIALDWRIQDRIDVAALELSVQEKFKEVSLLRYAITFRYETSFDHILKRISTTNLAGRVLKLWTRWLPAGPTGCRRFNNAMKELRLFKSVQKKTKTEEELNKAAQTLMARA